jgi:hypothetical protein
MANTDINGEVIVILTRDEAERVYTLLAIVAHEDGLNPLERTLAAKIARDLDLRPLE